MGSRWSNIILFHTSTRRLSSPRSPSAGVPGSAAAHSTLLCGRARCAAGALTKKVGLERRGATPGGVGGATEARARGGRDTPRRAQRQRDSAPSWKRRTARACLSGFVSPARLLFVTTLLAGKVRDGGRQSVPRRAAAGHHGAGLNDGLVGSCRRRRRRIVVIRRIHLQGKIARSSPLPLPPPAATAPKNAAAAATTAAAEGGAGRVRRPPPPYLFRPLAIPTRSCCCPRSHRPPHQQPPQPSPTLPAAPTAAAPPPPTTTRARRHARRPARSSTVASFGRR